MMRRARRPSSYTSSLRRTNRGRKLFLTRGVLLVGRVLLDILTQHPVNLGCKASAAYLLKVGENIGVQSHCDLLLDGTVVLAADADAPISEFRSIAGIYLLIGHGRQGVKFPLLFGGQLMRSFPLHKLSFLVLWLFWR